MDKSVYGHPSRGHTRPPILEAGPEANTVTYGFDVPQELPANGEMDEPAGKASGQGASTATAETAEAGENEMKTEDRRDSAAPLDVARSSPADQHDKAMAPSTVEDRPAQENGGRVMSSNHSRSPPQLEPTDGLDLYPYCQTDNVRLFPFKEPVADSSSPPRVRTAEETSHQIDLEMRQRMETLYPRFKNPPHKPFQTPQPASVPNTLPAVSNPNRRMYVRGARIVAAETWQTEDMLQEYIGRWGETHDKRRILRPNRAPLFYNPEEQEAQSSPSSNAVVSGSPELPDSPLAHSPTSSSDLTIRPNAIATAAANNTHDNSSEDFSPTRALLLPEQSSPSASSSPTAPRRLYSFPPPALSSTSRSATSARGIYKRTTQTLTLVATTLLFPILYVANEIRVRFSAFQARRGPLGSHESQFGRTLQHDATFGELVPNVFERHGYDRGGGWMHSQLWDEEAVGPSRYGTFGGGRDEDHGADQWRGREGGRRRDRRLLRSWQARLGLYGRYRARSGLGGGGDGVQDGDTSAV